MRIKLIQSGGLLALTKEADADVNWTQDETDNLEKQIALPADYSSAIRDGFNYTLEINSKEININLTKVPPKYSEIFDNLKKNLKIVKK